MPFRNGSLVFSKIPREKSRPAANTGKGHPLRATAMAVLTKREVSDAIASGSPVMVVVSGNYIGYADTHAMVVHGSRPSEVLLAGHLNPVNSSRRVGWKQLRENLEMDAWGLIVSRLKHSLHAAPRRV